MSGLRGAFQGLQKLALARLPHLNWGVLGGGGGGSGFGVLGFRVLGFREV